MSIQDFKKKAILSEIRVLLGFVESVKKSKFNSFANVINKKERIKYKSLEKKSYSELIKTRKLMTLLIDSINSNRFYRTWQIYNNIKKRLAFVIKNPSSISKLAKDPRKIISIFKLSANPFLLIGDNFQNYQNWLFKNFPTKKVLNRQVSESRKFKHKPRISLILPTYNTPITFLKIAIDSILKQSYPNWELCIVDDASSEPEIKKLIKDFAKIDKRIVFKFRKNNGHISRASNDAIAISNGEYIGIVDHDDYLWPNALFEVVKAINNNLDLQFIYTDEDKINESGTLHTDPFFKPDWSPDYLRSINYITHFCVIKKDLVSKVGGFNSKYDGAQDWDLFLKATYEIERNMETNPLSEKCVIHHIPEILYSWRMCKTSTASSESSHIVKNYAHGAQKKALEEDLKNRNLLGHVVPTPYLGEWYVNYSISSNPKVSIIIPTKDNYSYLNNCISSILTKTTYKNFEIVIVDTGSTSKRALDYYRELEATRKIKIINFKQEFNFSEACNHGAKASVGDYLLFLNNDTKVISTDWIQSMLQFSQRPSVGAVGALLLYPDRRIQHLGGILGIAPDPNETGIAGHAFKGADYDNFRHFDKYAVKNYSFVTAACLMINKKKFFHIGGFNPEYRIAFNDVDFCLRLLKQNLVNIINPNVTLYHYESVSVGHPTDKSRSRDTWKKELELFIKNWGDIKDKDPYFNINFSRNSENFLIKY